ncbi:MAG TPA: hypothetical protein VF848_12150 [Steroidobacteraceae bacterium]
MSLAIAGQLIAVQTQQHFTFGGRESANHPDTFILYRSSRAAIVGPARTRSRPKAPSCAARNSSSPLTIFANLPCDGTPSFYINRRRHDEAPAYKELDDAMDRALTSASD